MKRLALVVVALVVILWAWPARAADLEYTSFSSDITINADASLSITETIGVRFLSELHGIFRNIPVRYTTTDNQKSTIPISGVTVMQDGRAAEVDLSRSGDDLVIRVGDPDETITGDHIYVISYRAEAAVNFFSDHDELYWNSTGTTWDQPLANVQTVVHLPPGAAVDPTQLRCFTGQYGSTATDCEIQRDETSLTVTASTYLTVVVGWATGYVTKPANYDQLRFPPDRSYGAQLLKGFGGWRLVINIFLILLSPLWVYRLWSQRGRDPKGKGTIVAQYDPPPGLTPGEMGVLIDEQANQRDVIATIIDLAVRGHLSITETKEEKMLGLVSSKDYRLDKSPSTKAPGLKKHEQDLLQGLFESGDSVTLSSLRGKFMTTVTKIKNDLYDQVAEQGMFVSNPQLARMKIAGLGVGVIVLGFGLGYVGLWAPVIGGLLLTIFSGTFPRRTTAGVAAYWHARGFKLFLETAEKYRLQWQEKEHIFEQYLPYAMAFGVAEKWTKAFAGLRQADPTWYHGSHPGAFNALVLWSALDSFNSSAAKSFVSPGASGSSGFSGGFSGGGGGGGGGGGW